ncbi:sugar O-acetyltransferase [Aestuariibius insulae]|uniref:sugar O-acetyltransferase n=1 Tax=Aestuariibius insulae TaxID=2058287 RepID=UPI00345F0474
MTELEKMLAGAPYRPGDPDLVALRKRAQRLIRDYNATIYGDDDTRRALLAELLGRDGGATIRPPFYVDYGVHIDLGDEVFLNYGCVILDVCPVRIGDRTQIGPGTQILTADHPRDAATRAAGAEMGKPVRIGADVWIGGGALILPDVSIGNGAVIGAGSVVTRDVADGVTVAGNPARPLR